MTKDYDILAFSLDNPETLSDTQVTEIEQAIKPLLEPMPERSILQHLAAVDSATAGREDADIDKAVRATAFIEGLRDYPADVLAHAFKQYLKANKWRPTVADIREYGYYSARQRFSLDAAIQAEKRRRGENA